MLQVCPRWPLVVPTIINNEEGKVVVVVVLPLTGSLPLAERDESGLFTFCGFRGEGL